MKRVYDSLKRGARNAVRSAVRNHSLPHPNTLPCCDCGQRWVAGLPRHEYDHIAGYERAHWFDIVVRCARCHAHYSPRPRDARGRYCKEVR
jgi:hypothetical protein